MSVSFSKKHELQSPTQTISTRASMNRNAVSNISDLLSPSKDRDGARPLSYVPTFFSESKRANNSSTFVSPPFIGGSPNKDYINPTYSVSNDFFMATTTKNYPPRHQSVNNANSRIASCNKEVSDRGSVISVRSNSVISPKLDDAQSVQSYTSQNVEAQASKAHKRTSSARQNVATPKSKEDTAIGKAMELQPPSRRGNSIDLNTSSSRRDDSIFFRPTTKDTHKVPYTKDGEKDPNNLFIPLNVANKEIMKEKQAQKQEEIEIHKKLDEKILRLNEKGKALDAQNSEKRREDLKSMLRTNISIHTEKLDRLKNKTKEDLSSYVEVHQKPHLHQFLDRNTTQKSVLDKVADDAQNLEVNRMNSKFANGTYNKQKGAEEVQARNSEKKVDLQQNGIAKIGQPEIYQKNPEQQDYLTTLVSPSKSKNLQDSNINQDSLKHNMSYVDMVKSAYNHFNPEVQRKKEQKINEIRMKEAYEAMSKGLNPQKLSYSAVSKYLKEHSKSHIKY